MTRKKSTLVVPSVLIAFVGVLLAGWKSSNHGICSSGQELPGQQSICAVSETIYYIGIVLIVVGVVSLIVALVSHREATNQTSIPVSAPRGGLHIQLSKVGQFGGTGQSWRKSGHQRRRVTSKGHFGGRRTSKHDSCHEEMKG